MRVLIAFCLLATATAASTGYNYQQQQQQSIPQFQPSSTYGAPTGSGSGSIAPVTSNFLQEALSNTQLMQAIMGGHNQGGGYQLPQPQLQQQQQQQSYQAPAQQYQGAYQQPQRAPLVTKDIYVHVAPQEQEEQQYQRAPIAPPARKHYRIVFIKAPTHNIRSSALSINQAPIEEKTIIYVLTKKADPLELQAALQEAAPKQPSKPEVYFIKYKTQEEAQHAQRTIQAQYDQLGGTTQVSDEGIAPVTSVIGALDKPQQQSQHHQQQGGIDLSRLTSGLTGSGSVSAGASNKYLPPIVRI